MVKGQESLGPNAAAKSEAAMYNSANTSLSTSVARHASGPSNAKTLLDEYRVLYRVSVRGLGSRSNFQVGT